jgi:acyl-coenzyme A thioesterase PaaI-like protein
MCFVCGERNPHGLKAEFEIDKGNLRLTGKFTPREEHQGYRGIMHGGLASTLLDEAMVKLLWESGIPAVSGWLEIRLARPIPIGESINISGWVESRKGRMIFTAARLEDDAGGLLAEARGRCVSVSPKEDASGG